MAERRFEKGDLVLAKWPGSNLYFDGAVEDFNDIEYLVKFNDEDESQLAVKYKDVLDRNRIRTRSKSRGRSPARSKRASSKSPSRTKAPSKSPARTKAANKSPKANSRSPSRRAAKAEPKLEVSEISSKGSSSKALNSSSSSSVISSSFFLNSRSLDSVKQTTPLRQSARIASMDMNNDKDLSSYTRTITTTTTTSSSSSRGGKAGAMGALKQAGASVLSGLSALWSVLLPACKGLACIVSLTIIPLLFMQACTKKKCTVMEMPDIPMKFESYYDPKAVLIVLAALSLHVLLAFVPVRSRVLPNGAKDRGNGFVTLIISCLLVPLAIYLKYNVQLLYTLLRPLLATHMMLALLISLMLYVKSFYAPRSQKNDRTTGHFLPDLWEGREVTPRIGSVDLKSFFLRYSLCYTVVFNIILILRDVQLSKGVYSPVFIMACGMQIFFLTDFVWFEDNIFSMWEYNKQGFGYLLMASYLGFPFYFAVYTRFVLNHRPTLPWYCLVGIGLVFLAGYVLARFSNNQKHAFRTNPSSPKLAHLESIPTSAGTRLIVSGWWGVVRHPNYAGDLIVQVAYALLCGFSSGVSWLLVAMSALFVLFRIYENEQSCSRKYGLSWTNYTGRVKYRLIPKVF